MDVVGEKCNLSNRFKNGKPKVSVPLPKARVDAHSYERFSQAPQTGPQSSEAILETRNNLREKVPEGNCACSCESVSKLDVKVLTDHDGNKTQMSQRGDLKLLRSKTDLGFDELIVVLTKHARGEKAYYREEGIISLCQRFDGIKVLNGKEIAQVCNEE